MIAKVFKFFMFVFVAIVGIFALSIGIYAVSYEGRNDHSKFDQAITPSPLNQSNPAVVINSNLPLVRPSAVSRSANTPVRATQFAQSIPSSQTNPYSRPISDFSRPKIATTFRTEPTNRPQQNVVKNQIQLQLNEARLQHLELSQQYALDHPNVERLDRKIEMLEAQLKAETDNTATRPSLTPEQLELQQKIQRSEEQAARSANQLMNAVFRDEEARRSVRENLKKAVREAFYLRMELQQAQLDDAATKLEVSRQRLNRRQSLAKQIVERRVNELLGRDETKWNRQPSAASKVGPHLPELDQAARRRNTYSTMPVAPPKLPTRPDFGDAPQAKLDSPVITRLLTRPPALVDESRRFDFRAERQVRPAPTRFQTQPTRTLSLVDPMHEVGPGDVLSIFVPYVFDELGLSKTNSGYPIHVKSDGMVSLPSIGRLKVAGKTALEIEKELKKPYTDGPSPILEENDADLISVIVSQIYKSAPSADTRRENWIRQTEGNTQPRSPQAINEHGEARKIAQRFFNLAFSGDVNKANELTNNPGATEMLRRGIFPLIAEKSAPVVDRLGVANDRVFVHSRPMRLAKKYEGMTRATLFVSLQDFGIDGWQVIDVGWSNADDGNDNALPVPSPASRSDYSWLLGYWEVVSVEGKGAKFMTLDESTKVGETLFIPHIQTPIEKFLYTKIHRESYFERNWFSRSLPESWTKNDSLYLYPESSPARMTYRSKNGEKNHFSDSSDPPEFAIYKLDGDELTLMAGDPNDFKVNEGQETNRDSRGSPVHSKWRLVIPNYAKDFKLDPEKRQLLVKLRRVDPARAPAASPADKTDAIRTVPVGKAPPAFDLAPYKILFEKGSRKPESLLKKRTANGDGFPKYEHWAEAEPVEQFQGRWLVKRISINGEEVALDSAQANEVKMSNLIVFRSTLLANKPGGPEFFLLAYPNVPDAAILVDQRKPNRTKSLRFSANGEKLKVAMWDAYNRADPPQLKPNDEIIYLEFERKPATPGFFPVGNKPAASDLAPYSLLFNKGNSLPDSLLKKVSQRGAVPRYENWAAAEPVEKLRGQWHAKKISIEGKEVALDSAAAKKIQMTKMIVDGKMLLANQPDGPKMFLLAYPSVPDAAILVALDDSSRTTSLRFSVDGAKLKVAIADVCNRANLPKLKPDDDIIYIEYEREPEDRTELIPTEEKPPRSKTPTASD